MLALQLLQSGLVHIDALLLQQVTVPRPRSAADGSEATGGSCG
ncbi:hypothetical protein [Actinacidiphila oryziradicis]|jgi:hypothetical protein|nr:hypothetical protein [Actinacidiphila oryziradicis]